MTDVELKIEALIICVGRERFEQALADLTDGKGEKLTADRREVIAEELCALGISGNTVGFTALLELVDIVMDRDGCQTGGKLCAEIYPEAARRMGTSASAVEKSARNAILRGWDRGNRKAWKALFGSADEVCIRPNANNLINQVALDVQRRMRRVTVEDK